MGFKEMFGAMHGDSASLSQGRPDGVCASGTLAPADAWPQRNLGCLASESDIANHIENRALRIGQDDYAACVSRLGVKRIELRTTQSPQSFMTLA